MIAGFVEDAIQEGDASFVPVALRTAAAAIGGMSVLAERTGLSRETLYRTLSKNGNPRLDTLTAILGALGLRLSVEVIAPGKRVAKRAVVRKRPAVGNKPASPRAGRR